jgi:large-conductance mechanosensitive channel
MSNFVKFVRQEHILKLGSSVMVGLAVQRFFTDFVDGVLVPFVVKDKKEHSPVINSLVTLVLVIVFAYFLSKMKIPLV